MSLTAITEIAIALVLAYVLLSLLVTQANSAIGWLLKLRARTLVEFIRNQLLYDDTDQVLEHPLVSLVGEHGEPKRTENHIAPGLFVAGLLDVIVGNDDLNTMNIDSLRTKINTLPNEKLKQTLLALLKPVQSIEEAIATLEYWFEEKVAKTTQLYQNNMGVISFIIGLVLAVAFNVDTLRIIETLWNDAELRAQVADAATASIDQLNPLITSIEEAPPDNAESPSAEEISDQLDELQTTLDLLQESNLPIWWTGENVFVFPRSIIGWLLTAAATAKGAPFWFDMLQRLQTRKPDIG